MAANLFDHPYAAAANNLSDSDADRHSESEINFKDSPRKVLVQENKGGTLNILDNIIQSQNFSCLNKSRDSLKENGFQIDKSISSSDEMEVDKDISLEKEDSLEPNKCATGKEEKDSGTPNREVQEKDKLETSDTEPSKVLDIFCGITSVFDAKYIEQKSNVNGKHDDNSSDKASDEKQDSKNEAEISKKEEAGKTDKNEIEDSEKDLTGGHGGSEAEKEAQEMDTSVNDDGEDDDTEDADEGEFYNSLENATNLTSEIKRGEGNGIIVSVMKKKKRKRKRKNSLWTRSSPYKIRRLSDGAPRKVSTEESLQSKSEEGKDHTDRDINKDTESAQGNDESAENAGTQTSVEDSQQEEEKKGETSQSETPKEGMEDRLRSRRGRTPANKEGFEMGESASMEIEKVDSGFRRNLLFHKGRKASPAHIKPLTPLEAEKYKEPFKQGWKRELVFRGAYCESSVKTQADTYYFPPSGPKLRSMVQITDWLNTHDTTLTTENFTFMRRAIGVEGEMVRNASQSRGKALTEAASRKRKTKRVSDHHVHDDNDGQYDKPEVVIERDSDDFLATIITAVDKEKESTPVKEEKRYPGRTRKDREPSDLPNLEELKEEKVEMMQPSNEEVIISPSKKKKEHKATARKSTTQKTFKKHASFTGVENLCSLKCPGMEGIPPMLHCNVCMCLFHNECVNYFGQDGDFICLRCKDIQSPSEEGPATSVEGNIMKVNIPSLLSQLKSSTPSSASSLVRVYPVLESKNSSSAKSPILNANMNDNIMKAATSPSSMLPLYKMLPLATGSPGPTFVSASSVPVVPVSNPLISVAGTCTPFNYPVLLTQNTSALNSLPSSKSPFALFPPQTMKSQSVSSVPSVTTKSPALMDIINAKVHSDYQEIRPLIKQEPIDDSYQDVGKDGKSTPKGETTTKASSEALDNLKNVLSTRLGGPNSTDHKVSDSKSKPSISNMNLLPQTFSPVPAPVRLMSSMNPNFLGNNNQVTISQNLNQPRMAFNLKSPPQTNFLQNQEYRIVPIGPPLPLSKLQERMALRPGSNFLPMPMMTSPVRQPVTLSPQIAPRPEKMVTSVVVTSKEDTSTSGSSGPLVVNAKSVTPMNGQLLTLPPPVVKKLTLNKPLALKINNRQITVPPSGFFQSTEGLKVFLPPNTFPTADENIVNVSVTNEKSVEDESVAKSSTASGSAESQTSVKKESSPNKDETNKNNEKSELVTEVTKVSSGDVTRNKFYKKCCTIKQLHGGYDCMFHIFKLLALKDLVRASQVCKTWRRISLTPDLWTCVSFSGTMVCDWGKALKYISRREVQSLILKNLAHYGEANRTWHQLVSSLPELSLLNRISFGLVPAAVLQSVAGKLTQLESFIAESVSDFTDESMWNVPTKLDVGNFSCLSKLKELKLRGTGGLSLPSFSFGCGFADLGKLTNLQILHLTSLRNLEGSDFNFISNLTKLKELALGDCEKWTQETYSHLQKLTSLQYLQLENGGEIPDTGLGLALSHLLQLETLELKKYTVAYTFGNHISGLAKLRHLSIFPLNMHYMGEVNTNTLRAVENLRHLKTLEWTIPQTSTSSIILDDSSNTGVDQTTEDDQHWIPFQTVVALEQSEGTKNSAAQYISVQQLKEKLVKSLPDTKVKVCTAQTEKKLH